ncbi:MAG: YceI family protein [Bryobacteraceae bacterium]
MQAEHYAIDAGQSSLTVRAFAAGLLSALGHSPTLAIREFAGEASFIPGTFENASVKVKVRSGSLRVVDTISGKDRSEIEQTMNRDVLETEKYPDIVFESSKVSASKAGDGQYWINLVGELSLHGVTNSQPIAAQVAVTGDTLRAHGEFSLLQTSYKIKLVSVAGGTLKIKDEVKCSFDIVARRQPGMSGEQKGRMLAVEGS